jgi:hypothetical protein
MDYERAVTQSDAGMQARRTFDSPGAGLGPTQPPREIPAVELAFKRLESAKEFLASTVQELSDRLTPVLHVQAPTAQTQEKRPHMGAPMAEGVMLQADYVEATAVRLRELISGLAI